MKRTISLTLAAFAITAFAGNQTANTKLTHLESDSRFSTSKLTSIPTKSAKLTSKPASHSLLKDEEDVELMYVMPKDAFRSAFYLSEGAVSSFAATLVPPTVPVTFRNVTSGGNDSDFKWTFYNGNLSTDSLSVEHTRDLTTSFHRDCANLYASPRLYYGDIEAYYYTMEGGMRYGGALEFNASADGSVKTTLSNYDSRADFNDITLLLSSYAGKDASMYVPWYDFYNDILSRQSTATSAQIISMMHHFNAPARPYAFSRVSLIATVTGKAGQAITCKVVTPTAHGDIESVKPIATAQYVLAGDLNDELLTLDFNFDEWLAIDKEIYVLLEGIDQLDLFAPMIIAANDNYADLIEKQGYCKWMLYNEEGQPVDECMVDCSGGYAWGFSEDDMTVGTHFAISINAQYDYIAAGDAQETTVEITETGETQQLAVEASEVFANWNITGKPEWLTLQGTDVMKTDEEVGEYFSGIVNLDLTADALPEGVSNREATILVALKTQTLAITVKQGEAGPVPSNGDINMDGSVDITDANILVNILLNGNNPYGNRADVNGDGVIDITDTNAIINMILSGK